MKSRTSGSAKLQLPALGPPFGGEHLIGHLVGAWRGCGFGLVRRVLEDFPSLPVILQVERFGERVVVLLMPDG